MSDTNNKKDIDKVKYPLKVRISYGIGGFLDNFIVAAFTVRIYDFYENELFLATALVGLAITIYGFWNMINDPLIGYLSDKSTRFVKKWGRRFPWYTIGILSYVWIYLLVFIVPFSDQGGMFIWLLVTIISFELTFTLWQANYVALFPDKFRSQTERTMVGTWNTIWGVIGIALGVLIPPLLITYGDPTSYIVATLFVAVLAFIMAIFSLPGMREDEELREREYKAALESKEKATTFWQALGKAVKDRNMIAYFITYLGHQVMTNFMLGSLPYWTKFIIYSSDSSLETIMSAGFLLAVLFVGTPLWSWIGKRVGNKKSFIYGTLSTTLLFIPLIFVSDLIGTTIAIALIGIGISCIWVLMYPCFSDVIDSIVIKTGERREGLLTGIRTFFGRAPVMLQGAIFSIIHITTGFIPSPTPIQQTALALFGIRLHMAIIPMIFYFIGFLMMWKVYNLDTECVEQNKEILMKEFW